MHNRDYYDILGLSSSATPEQIRQAYRRRARECHPDHGGSHDVMVALNEAYFVLSDRGRRTKYDSFRSRAGPEQAVARWQQTPAGQETHAKAAEYPREWAQFERWMNAIVSDFKQAEYGEDGYWPIIKKSISGSIFIFIGGCGGAAAWYLIIYIIFGGLGGFFEAGSGFLWTVGRYLLFRFSLIPFLIVGAWIGSITHRATKDTICHNGVRHPHSLPSNRYREVSCPKCNQQLRIPTIDKSLDVTCRKCGHVFGVPSIRPA